ncbi:hypothetical protein CJU90_2855 [Yarrowia sp. C11]|nr:hypothetical protein CKK34_4302 [Yarrowia sp. E02]KAG5369404.1 hypothetical protein CJU90_2855 [Yarrowia sp. C11]
MYFFVKNTEPETSSNSTIHNLNDELTVPDPQLGLVATYARDGHGYRKEEEDDGEDVVPKDEEKGYDLQAELTQTTQKESCPSLWTSLAQLARAAAGAKETQTPSIALEIGYPNVEDNKGYKLNLGLVKVAVYARGVTKPKVTKATKSAGTSSNRWVVRMPQAVDATRLRVYPDGQVTGNYEYAVKAFGLKVGVGMYRPVNAYRYRIDRFGVRRTESS